MDSIIKEAYYEDILPHIESDLRSCVKVYDHEFDWGNAEWWFDEKTAPYTEEGIKYVMDKLTKRFGGAYDVNCEKHERGYFFVLRRREQ